MSDSLKLAEMQRTNIEFERQRHLANWLIKSSPHMATPPTAVTLAQQQQQQQFHQQHNHTANSSSCNNSATALVAAAAAAAAGVQTTATTAIATNNTISSSLPTNPSSLIPTSLSSSNNVATTTTNSAISPHNITGSAGHSTAANGSNHLPHHYNAKQHGSSGCVSANNTSNTNPVFYLMSSNGNTGSVGGSANVISSSNVTTASKHTGPFLGPHAHHPHSQRGLHHLAEGRKAKLRRFNSHDTSSNMFSVADFENARLARRNEIELKQRLQRRMRHGYSGGSGSGLLAGGSCGAQGLFAGGMGDYSTGDSKTSRNSNESQNEPLQVEEFLERYSLPRVVRISYKTLFSNETLQSSSSNNSSTVTSNSSSSAKNALPSCSSSASPTEANPISSNSNSNTGTSSSSASSGLGGAGNNPITQTLASNSSNNSGGKCPQTEGPSTNTSDVNHNNSRDEEQGELFLLYRLVRQRHIYHGHNAKTTATNRKKGVMIPQEFPALKNVLLKNYLLSHFAERITCREIAHTHSLTHRHTIHKHIYSVYTTQCETVCS